MPSVRLSPHFTLRELCRSGVALRYGMSNVPERQAVDNLRSLTVAVLEPLRVKFGAVRVNSGYRSPDLNAKIGGATRSQHMFGEAADVETLHIDNKEAATWIADTLEFDQLILEHYTPGHPSSGWIHVSYVAPRLGGRKNRRQVLSKLTGRGGYVEGLKP